MKKIVKLSLFVLSFFLVTSCGTKETSPNNNDQNPLPIEESLDNETVLKQGNLELRNIKITANGSINTVTATIKNVGLKISSFDAVLYLKSKDGLILGKIDQRLVDLKTDESRNISVEIMGDYTTVKTYELVVENLIEK
jgi:uncharacterized protein YabE (DUF348 family)